MIYQQELHLIDDLISMWLLVMLVVKILNISGFESSDEAVMAYKRVKQELLRNLANSLKGEIEDRVYNKLITYYKLE